MNSTKLTGHSDESTLFRTPDTPGDGSSSSDLNDKVHALPSVESPSLLVPLINL